jgi:MoaA/NifB/PqqE/SkfB family radical SAM enzyme
MTVATELLQEYTSTGSKLFFHQEAMANLRNGKGQPIVSHVMPTDVCNFRCAFCSVQHRAGDSLKMEQIVDYLNQLVPLGLKAVILSGGGNPCLYRDGKHDFNSLVEYIYGLGLEIGLITNGQPMVQDGDRMTWKGIRISTLDMLTWVRISLSGFDHPQDRCDTPDFDPAKTTLGGSYVLHDIYDEPADKKHQRVSTPEDVITPNQPVTYGVDRIPRLKEQMKEWADRYKPKYVRLLPNCLEPSLIQSRSKLLEEVAREIDPSVFFVQVKPPRQPKRCLKGYPHPVANCDGWVYPCDSVVLNRTAGHKFDSSWRICRMEDIGKFYAEPIRPNVPNNICPGCVFSDQVDLISNIADGMPTPLPDGPEPEHVSFV